MKSFERNLSLRSLSSWIYWTVTSRANLLTKPEFMQFISIGSKMISCRCLPMYSREVCTKGAIYRKSELIRILTAVFISIRGLAPCTNFISQSKIVISQCTEMSISSRFLCPAKYLLKYFMCSSSKILSHLKSWVFFFASSHTCITTVLRAVAPPWPNRLPRGPVVADGETPLLCDMGF